MSSEPGHLRPPSPSRITLYTLGGTIASTDNDASGARPRLEGAELLGPVTATVGDVEVEAVSVRRVASGELTLVDALYLAQRIRDNLGVGRDGVVITQGTDTIEEFAFALDLLIDTESPIVVTGAMRHPGELGADGPANLAASISAASDQVLRGAGVVVVMNDEIHAARFVRKSNSANVAAFTSPSTGVIGRITEGRTRLYVRPPRLERVIDPARVEADVPSVLLFGCALGDDGRILERVADLGYAGVVLEGFGGGHVPARMVAPLASVAATMPVVLASRTGSGDVLASTYGYDGSERDLLGRGLISAGFLDGRKARILLSFLLGMGASREEVAVAFARLHRSATGLP